MKKIFFMIIFFGSSLKLFAIPMYFCTAADQKYFNHLINLIGSIHANNYKQTQEIAVFDLGLTIEQKNKLNAIEKVKLYDVEITHPDLLKNFKTHPQGKMIFGWYAWKPVAIKQSLEKFPYVLWVDAGTTILKPLDNLFEYIKESGYFLMTIGNEIMPDGSWRHPLKWGMTKFVKEAFQLNQDEFKWVLDQEFIDAGILGVSQKAIDEFIMPLYNLSYDLTYYQDDGTTPDGFGTGRHDQTLLSIMAYLKGLTIFKTDYMQKKPMLIPLNGKNIPFFMTWNPHYISDKTDIYHSRGDLSKSDYYKNKIQYRK